MDLKPTDDLTFDHIESEEEIEELLGGERVKMEYVF